MVSSMESNMEPHPQLAGDAFSHALCTRLSDPKRIMPRTLRTLTEGGERRGESIPGCVVFRGECPVW
jgi:hypothetical protein